MKCEACGDVFDIPAAGPWNHDMSMAPHNDSLLFLDRDDEVCCGYITSRGTCYPHFHDDSIDPVAWAEIHTPAGDAH